MIGFDPCGHMPPLETERLLLRRLNMHDAKDIFEYSRDPERSPAMCSGRHSAPSATRAPICAT